MNSRQKGARGERELASRLRDYGYDSRRGQQFSGANGDPDVVGLPNIHIECKRVERLNLEDAMAQAKRDAREGEIPAVFHRKNHCEWLVTMELDSFIQLYREWGAFNEGN
jgi:Holliday junction resolvase